MGVDVEALKRAAEGATPGPWKTLPPPQEWVEFEGTVFAPEYPDDFDNSIARTTEHCDAAYIAAASPDVILALIERLVYAEERAEVAMSELLHATDALETAERVVADLQDPPVWGPNEQGDFMVDMDRDAYRENLKRIGHALNGSTPARKPR